MHPIHPLTAAETSPVTPSCSIALCSHSRHHPVQPCPFPFPFPPARLPFPLSSPIPSFNLAMASFALGGASVVSAGAVAVAGAVGHLLRPRDDGRTLPNVMAARALGGRTWNPTGGFIGSVKGGGVGSGSGVSSAPVKDITEGAKAAPKAAAPKAAAKAAPKAAPAPEKKAAAAAPKAAAKDDASEKPPSPFELFGFKPTMPGPPPSA